MPEWNLGDLYPAIDAPELKRDLETAESEAKRFAEEWKGKLSILAANNQLGEAIRQYEVLEEILGRIMSFASLTYAGETANPAKATGVTWAGTEDDDQASLRELHPPTEQAEPPPFEDV